MYGKILSPLDGSQTSRRGMSEAIRLARDQGARLRFLHVVDIYLLTLDSSGALNVGDMLDTLRSHGMRVLEEAGSAAREQGVDADYELIESTSSRIGEAIVEYAKQWGAELIVMGTHGRRGVSHLFMGSDAETVIRTSPVPVLLVRVAEGETVGSASGGQPVR